MLLTKVKYGACFLIFFPLICFGQEFTQDRVTALDKKDILDAFAIHNVVFVNRRSALPREKDAITDLSKIISVDQAAIHGKPGPDVLALIRLMLGTPHFPRLDEIAACDQGNAGYVWKVTWKLFPSPGLFSGIPFQYREWVKPDGTPIFPERYLCDHLRQRSVLESDQIEIADEPGADIFSVMSFADFNVMIEPARKIHGDDVLLLAKTSLEKLVSEANVRDGDLKQTFRFHSQNQREIPVAIDGLGKIVTKSVWEVNFIDSRVVGDAIENANPLTIWVTSDGIASQLSLDRWEAKAQRVN